MEAIEKLGVRVSNPEQSITIEGGAFADLVLYQHLSAENLRRCLAALNLANLGGENELLAEVQTQLLAMTSSSSGVLHELLRVAREQGLRFEIIGDRTRH